MNTNRLMKGKKGLIVGVANERSIGYGIAKSLYNAGATFAMSARRESVKKRLEVFSNEFNAKLYDLDLNNDEQLKQLNESIKNDFGTLDFIVHSVAFAPKSALKGRLIDTPRDAFNLAMETSVFSLIALINSLEGLLSNNASILSISYIGASRYVLNYNVMGLCKAALECASKYLAFELGSKGIRINVISAGPIRTLASSGISDFKNIMDASRNNSALNKDVSINEVGNSALYLLSELSSGVTGEIHFVDAGYNVSAITAKVIDKVIDKDID